MTSKVASTNTQLRQCEVLAARLAGQCTIFTHHHGLQTNICGRQRLEKFLQVAYERYQGPAKHSGRSWGNSGRSVPFRTRRVEIIVPNCRLQIRTGKTGHSFGLIQMHQQVLQRGIRVRVIAHGCQLAKIAEEQFISRQTLNRLHFSQQRRTLIFDRLNGSP